ncbi:TGL1 [Candida theae]|uniref:TGL1 n=1 Tax=Candida theae TaxID=1198502 RepID=A0AAD5BE65_9ASCO|nr:TGL1 [Candida theae]KAI5957515.1 TGL1 [Candida theae]
MSIPLLGRLNIFDWPFIIISFTLAWFEFLVSVITTLLPWQFINACTTVVKQFFRFTSNPIVLITQSRPRANSIENEERFHYLKEADITKSNVSKQSYDLTIEMLNAETIHDMVSLFGYEIESRIVTTKDGYLLNLHRLGGGSARRVPNGRVVYLHHGLLMCSEVWVTMIEKYQNLPFVLYDLGYDVWMGNNRGNKYSQKHLVHDVHSVEFWNFSIDEFALFDIPNSIDYILSDTGKEKLTYIGFSQGSAQAFASVSVNSDLNNKIDQLIAISPATTPHGLYSKFLDILLKSSPNVTYLLFSRKVLMPSCIFWQKIMYPPLFDKVIDISNYLLFNWRSLNISKLQKLSSYAHLYSTTSVKCVVHWFQVMSSKNFQMYFDTTTSSSLSGLHPVSYPLKNIQIPVHLIYGTIDSLVDIEVMKSQLPKRATTTYAVDNHEHLDNLWGVDVFESVFKRVLQYLGEDIDDVYSRLFRTNDGVKLIEDILRADNEPSGLAIDTNSIQVDNTSFNNIGDKKSDHDYEFDVTQISNVSASGQFSSSTSSQGGKLSYLKLANNRRKSSAQGSDEKTQSVDSTNTADFKTPQSVGSTSVFI